MQVRGHRDGAFLVGGVNKPVEALGRVGTRAYAARLTAAGKTKKDILRCLKRAIARQVFHLITNPRPVENSSDLRPARKNLGLALTDVADGLHCAISKISLIERGTIRDTRFLDHYRAWLTTQQHAQIAA